MIVLRFKGSVVRLPPNVSKSKREGKRFYLVRAFLKSIVILSPKKGERWLANGTTVFGAYAMIELLDS